MSSRTVAVILRAQVDDYMRHMRDAQRQTDEVDRAARSATEQLRIHGESLAKVGAGMVAVGAAAAAGLLLAEKAAIDYGSKMAQLQSLSHATQGDMQRLSDAAMKQGTAFGYSATQVAEAEIELTKAGRDTTQILGGDLKGALALAAAGQLDVAQATSIGVTALTQFSRTGATIPQVADALAAGADKALGSVQDLGMALQQGGLVASQMGLDLNDTVGTLSAFAQAGLIGSDAGTSLKTMLLSLQSPSKQAKELLDQYNIAAYDQRGNFVGITKLAGELQAAFKGKSQAERDAALSTIFGSDAIRSANVLYTQGAKGIQGWIDGVNDTGFASAQAAGKLNSLQGDLQKLSAAFQTDLIKAGSSADGGLRGLAQTATALVIAIGGIPQPLMAVGTGATALVAAVGLVGGAALIAAPKIVAFKFALDELGISGRRAAVGLGRGAGLALALTSVASGFAGLAQQGTASAQQVSLAGETAMKGWKGLADLFKGDGGFLQTGGFKQAFQDEQFQAPSAKILDGLTFGITHFSDVYKTNEGAFDALGQQLAGLAQQDYGKASSSFADLVGKYKLGADDTKRLLSYMPAYRDELVKQAEAAHVTASDTNLLLIAQGKGAVSAKVLATSQAAAAKSAAANAEKVADLAGQATSAKGSIDDLSNAIKGFGSVTLDARSAQRDFEKAVDDARAAAKKSGDATKDSTQADRDKQAALDGVASSAIATAAAFAKQPGGVKKAQAALEDGRKAFLDVASQMGIGRKEAKKLADQLGLIPANVKTAVDVSGIPAAEAKLGDLQGKINTLVNGHYVANVNFATSGSTVTGPVSKGPDVARRAGGGSITGPGPKGVDSVMAILAPGEHVLTAAEVDRMGGQGAVSAFRADLMAFAKGGPVDKGGVTRLTHSSGSDAKRGSSPVDQQQDEVDHLQRAVDRDEDALKRAKTKAQKAAAQKKLDADQAKLKAAQDRLYDLQGGDLGDAKRDAKAAADDAADAKNDLDDRKKAADKAKAEADKAQKAYEKAQDAAQKIHGKGTADAKHDAQIRVKKLQRAAQAAKKKQDKADKKQSDAQDAYDKAKEKSDDAISRRTDLTRDREDFVSAERRNPDRATTDPLAYVDQLRDMSRDDNFDPARQKKFDDAANKYEQSLSDLTKQASTAADTLATLKDSAKQMHDSIQQSFSGSYSLGGAKSKIESTSATSGWIMRDGIAYQTTTTGTTSASSIAGYYAAGAATASQFADALKQLAGRGLNTSLLAELAQMGTEEGLPIAQAILAGSDGDLASLNGSYGAIAAAGDRAGTTVSDANFAAQIANADANAKRITDEIAAQGQQLRSLIGKAFGLPGYATGTASATAGIHWVGEDGPELVGFGGGEAVLNAAASKRWVSGYGGSGGAVPRITVQAPIVNLPDTITVQDASGFRATMRVVAREEIRSDAAQDAVLMMGGPA